MSRNNHDRAHPVKVLILSRPLAPLFIALSCGIIAGSALLSPALILLFLLPPAIAVLTFLKINKIVPFFNLGLLFFCFFSMGVLSSFFPPDLFTFTSTAPSPVHISEYIGRGKLTVIGTILKMPENRHRTRLTIEVESVLANGNKSTPRKKGKGQANKTLSPPVPTKGVIRLSTPSTALFAPGMKIRFMTKISSFRSFSNPGCFDYKGFMKSKGISASAYSRDVAILDEHFADGFFIGVEKARQKIAVFIEAHVSKDRAGIVKALAIGDKSGISPATREAFANSGTAHVLAISGLHVGMVAMFSFFVLKTLLSFFNFLNAHALTKKIAALLSILPITAYALLSGLSPSTQRAAIMAVVFLVAAAIDRDKDHINTLSLAGIIILAIRPLSIFSASFQLSFSAVFFIVAGLKLLVGHDYSESKGLSDNDALGRDHAAKNQAFKKARTRARDQFLFRLSVFLLVPALAFAGTLPFAMAHFNAIAPIGLIANLIVVPLTGFIAVPLCLLSIVVLPVFPGASSLGFKLAAMVTGFTSQTAEVFCLFPFSSFMTFSPTWFEVAIYYTLILSIAGLKYFSRARYFLLAAIMLAVGDAGYWVNKRFFNENFTATIVDVRHGNCALLEFPGGKTALIDGGGFSDNSKFDIGKLVVAPFLLKKKIMTIDFVILTHPESDHLNGLIHIADRFNVKEIFTNGARNTTKGFEQFQQMNMDKIIVIEPPASLKVNGADLSFMYPPKGFMEMKKKNAWRDLNNCSLVTRIDFGDSSILFPGDIRKMAEKELVASNAPLLDCDILVSPHHGSNTSNTDIFLDSVAPNAVIISSGFKSRFNLPNPHVIKRLQSRNLPIFRTDHHGAIKIIFNGRGYEITTARPLGETG